MSKKGIEPAGLKKYRLSKKKRGGRSVSKSKTKRVHRKTKMTLPLSVILGFTPLVAKGIGDFRSGGVSGLRNTVSAVVPWNFQTMKPSVSNLGYGLIPIVLGIAVHKFVGGTLGVNRALGRMGMPLIRL